MQQRLKRTRLVPQFITKSLPRVLVTLLAAHSAVIFAAEVTLPTLISKTIMQPRYVQLDGRLEAINQGTVSAQTSGIVETVTVDVNDSVSAGQVLATINNTQQQAQLSQTQAHLAQEQALNEDAQILLRRNRSLFARKTLSQGELDSSIAAAKSRQAAVLAAMAKVKQAQEQLSYTRVLAPYSGIVSQRLVQVGELVSPGQPVMAGFSPQPLRIIIDIPQHLLTKLNISADQPIKIQANGKTITTQQYTLFPYADSRYSSVRARIDLTTNNNEQTLLPGSWVEVLLPADERAGIYLPQSAILQQGEVASLYIKHPTTGRFKLRYVRLGQKLITQQSGPQVEVIAGLSSDEEVAINALAIAQQIHSHQSRHKEQ